HRRQDQRRHQQGAAEPGSAAPARGRQYSGQADAATRSRRADEGGPREADQGDRDLGHGAAVGATSSRRHCEERSDEAIHSAARGTMDCFASLAMTTESVVAYFFTLLASIFTFVSSIFVENAVPTSNGFSMPRYVCTSS